MLFSCPDANISQLSENTRYTKFLCFLLQVSFFRKMIKSAGKTVKASKVGRVGLKPYVAKCQQLLKHQSTSEDVNGSTAMDVDA